MMLPPPRPEEIVPESFVIYSITKYNDVAHVIGDFPYAKVDLIFARIQGNWYLIGKRTLQDHGG